MKKLNLVLIILTTLLLSTGCWDMIEINQRTYPYSVGVDLNHGEGEEYIITMSYININGIGKNATQEERVFVVSTTASGIFEASHKLSTEIAYPIYFKHLRVLVLGQELAESEHDIRQILDGLSRDFVIDKKMKVATAEGKAKDVLEGIPSATKQEQIEGSLFALLKDNNNTTRYSSKTLTRFISDMEKGDVLIPRIKIEGEDVIVFGACIVKNYGVIGHLDELQNRAISFLKDEVSLELITAPYNDSFISYEVTGEDVKRKLIVDGENLIMKIDIEIEGALQEHILMEEVKKDEIQVLESMEKAIKDSLEGEIEDIINLLQNKYGADPIGVADYISKFHPKIWKEVSENWEEIFSEMKIDVSVNPHIRRRGLIQ